MVRANTFEGSVPDFLEGDDRSIQLSGALELEGILEIGR